MVLLGIAINKQIRKNLTVTCYSILNVITQCLIDFLLLIAIHLLYLSMMKKPWRTLQLVFVKKIQEKF